MIKASELRDKDVIDINTGQKLGNIVDIEINLEEGRVEGIVIPKETSLFRFFNKDIEIYLSWESIKKIGTDVILVDFKDREA
ncbi:sporulation protein, YlmC/YmxH family [Thermoanaerobacter uzonensis DSM 18761]|jgi:YlmC/YmxH family sporulation protein|uniref:Sporulation protein, YlmC/YmxH family n=1 Tax=Thermoanaerobacter uzonensis DSM 18761 TaxID=1123369 RepID=A0A1M4WVK8_9THEO|nr:YlmC/YmxH family sporulation protein [Thermoanaerobacter uzonensis]SHE85002.1 sporulation protein, YlmC/YmxH family [Thermoanaerobacter uzonensis DSM 18761]